MKVITLFRNSGENIVLTDEDQGPMSDYTNNLSGIFTSRNVIQIDVTGESILVRPSRIDAIHVHEVSIEIPEDTYTPAEEKESEAETPVETPPPETFDDEVISD